MEIMEMSLPVGTTLDRFIFRNQHAFPFATGELSQLLRDISLAAKVVNRELSRFTIGVVNQTTNSINVQGEVQQRLDIIADNRFIRALKNGGQVCALLSEENEDLIFTGNPGAKYVVAIDPLDGSSNVDLNVCIGSIFSIYKRINNEPGLVSVEDFFQGGRKQIASGYILYGAAMQLCFTTGKGLNAFTYDESIGEFILSQKDIIVPNIGSVYSCNDGSFFDFEESDREYINYCMSKRFSQRYLGSLVGDMHRTILKGGIYLYPVSGRYPRGKLRLLYECFPLAFMVEQAGGMAVNGAVAILDIDPFELHQRSPFIAGSADMVSKYMRMAR